MTDIVIQMALTGGYVVTVEAKQPGRPRREEGRKCFIEEDLVNAQAILSLQATNPPRCPCGVHEYEYYFDHRRRLTAECRRCHSKRYWSTASHVWGPFAPKS